MARLLIAGLLFLAAMVHADGLGDLNALTTALNANASNISTLANSTDTNKTNVAAAAQSMVDAVSSQISTTHQNVANAQTAWTSGASPSELSAPYTTYCSAVRTLANALTTLGKAISLGAPGRQSMVNTINACNDAVHDFGSYLYTHNIVTRPAWVSTLGAMDTLTSAEGFWSAAGDSTPAQESGAAASPSSQARMKKA